MLLLPLTQTHRSRTPFSESCIPNVPHFLIWKVSTLSIFNSQRGKLHPSAASHSPYSYEYKLLRRPTCSAASFLNIFPKTMWTCTYQTLVLSQNLEFSDLTCSLFTPFLCGNLDCSNVTHSESWLKALLRELQLSANNRAVERIIFGLSNAVLKYKP